MDREEWGVLMHVEGSQNPPSANVYTKLEKVKVLEFLR